MKTIQLTISGCLGPCDIPNVIAIATPTGSEWFGNVTQDAEYEALLVWAERCAGEGRVLPLPPEFEAKRIRRWRE